MTQNSVQVICNTGTANSVNLKPAKNPIKTVAAYAASEISVAFQKLRRMDYNVLFTVCIFYHRREKGFIQVGTQRTDQPSAD